MRATPNRLVEAYRVVSGRFASKTSYGNNGLFYLPNIVYGTRTTLMVLVSDGEGWEHASITIRKSSNPNICIGRCPTWDEMCYVKHCFWDDEETVIQFHPPKSAYVNNHQYCLHLWKPLNYTIPTPPSILVGIVAGGSQ